MTVSALKFGFNRAILTIDNSDASPHSANPASAYLDIDDAKELIKQLYAAFPEIETPVQALSKGYKNAKAHIQFPVCACRFADDEETLISPCMAHLEWAKSFGAH